MAIDSTYHFIVNTPVGKQECTLVLESVSPSLAQGNFKIFGKDNPLSGLVVDGNSVKGPIELEGPLGKVKTNLDVIADGKKCVGKLKSFLYSTELNSIE